MFGGMPATGAIARTAVNVRSGARTRVSAIVHSLVLLGVVYLATGPVAAIPLSALAGGADGDGVPDDLGVHGAKDHALHPLGCPDLRR